MNKGITQKMADKMVMYRIIGRGSACELYDEVFTHGPDIKSYAKAIKELEEYRKRVNRPGNYLGSDTTYTLVEVTCKVLSV